MNGLCGISGEETRRTRQGHEKEDEGMPEKESKCKGRTTRLRFLGREKRLVYRMSVQLASASVELEKRRGRGTSHRGCWENEHKRNSWVDLHDQAGGQYWGSRGKEERKAGA
ncbi:hypothetical protein TRVL_02569 [Trypanosoma vivax]|nr:hypothetical protein TRVL_02569 [Trypanosoma vivax]